MIKEYFFRSPFNYDTDLVSEETGLKCEDETLAQQQFAEEVDINTILRRFGLTGELPTGVRMPTYGDFTEVHDFHSAVNAIAIAHEAFDAMPADVRARFNNDPGAFMEFVNKDSNRDEAVRLGLVVPPAPAPVSGAPAGGGEGSVAPPGSTVPT